MNRKFISLFFMACLVFSGCSTKGQKSVKKVIQSDLSKVLYKKEASVTDVESALKLAAMLKTIKGTFPQDKAVGDVDKILQKLKIKFTPLHTQLSADFEKEKSVIVKALPLLFVKLETLANQQQEKLKKRGHSSSQFKKDQCLFFYNGGELDKLKYQNTEIAQVESIGSEELRLKTILSINDFELKQYDQVLAKLNKSTTKDKNLTKKRAVEMDCQKAYSLQKEFLSWGVTIDSLESIAKPIRQINTMNSNQLI